MKVDITAKIVGLLKVGVLLVLIDLHRFIKHSYQKGKYVKHDSIETYNYYDFLFSYSCNLKQNNL